MKKIINISLVLILSMTLLVGCSKKQDNNLDNSNNIENNNSNILENKDVLGIQIVEQFTFEITSLTYENDVSILEYNIINNSDEEIVIPYYTVLISDKDGIRYEFDKSHKDKILKPNKTIKVKKEIKKDLTKATSINFELIEEENR